MVTVITDMAQHQAPRNFGLVADIRTRHVDQGSTPVIAWMKSQDEKERILKYTVCLRVVPKTKTRRLKGEHAQSGVVEGIVHAREQW